MEKAKEVHRYLNKTFGASLPEKLVAAVAEAEALLEQRFAAGGLRIDLPLHTWVARRQKIQTVSKVDVVVSSRRRSNICR